MRHARLLAAALTMILLTPSAYAQQGLFTERGFGGEIGYQTGDNVSSYGLDLGYAVNRIFEAGLGLQRQSVDGSDIKSTYITPRVRGYFLRQNPSMPVSVWGEAKYHFVSYSGDGSDNLSGSGWGIGVGAAHAIAAGETLRIQPFASLAYTEEEVEIDGGVATITVTSNPLLITAGAHIAGAMGPGTVYGAPFVQIWTEDGNSTTQIGVKIGLVLNQ
jgi:hypothetical protein